MQPVNNHPATEEDERQDYIVRLMFRVSAYSPRDAVARFIEQLVRYGLRPWTYRVDVDGEDEIDSYLVDGELVVQQHNGDDLSTQEKLKAEQQMVVVPQDPRERPEG